MYWMHMVGGVLVLHYTGNGLLGIPNNLSPFLLNKEDQDVILIPQPVSPANP